MWCGEALYLRFCVVEHHVYTQEFIGLHKFV